MTHRCAHVQLKLMTKEQTTKQKTKKKRNEYKQTNKNGSLGTITKSSKKFENSHWLTAHRGHG
jgi:hypothetical protein